METNTKDAFRTPAYERVIPVVGSIQDAARMLLGVASEPRNPYEIQMRKNVLRGVAKYVSGLENPSGAINEMRGAISQLGAERGIAPDVIGQARALAFTAYNKSI